MTNVPTFGNLNILLELGGGDGWNIHYHFCRNTHDFNKTRLCSLVEGCSQMISKGGGTKGDFVLQGFLGLDNNFFFS